MQTVGTKFLRFCLQTSKHLLSSYHIPLIQHTTKRNSLKISLKYVFGRYFSIWWNLVTREIHSCILVDFHLSLLTHLISVMNWVPQTIFHTILARYLDDSCLKPFVDHGVLSSGIYKTVQEFFSNFSSYAWFFDFSTLPTFEGLQYFTEMSYRDKNYTGTEWKGESFSLYRLCCAMASRNLWTRGVKKWPVIGPPLKVKPETRVFFKSQLFLCLSWSDLEIFRS